MSLDLKQANSYLKETALAIESLDRTVLESIAKEILEMQKRGGTLWSMGNGGSASTGAHLACDVGKGISLGRSRPFRAFSLNEQMTVQSAWSNDFGHENAFANHLKHLATSLDVVMLISGSGNSSNIVKAAKWASESKIMTISLVGASGGVVSEYSSLELRVNSEDMQVIENVHLVVVHWIYKAMVFESPDPAQTSSPSCS